MKKRRSKRSIFLAVIVFIAITLFLFFNFKKKEVDYFVLKPVDFEYTILASCSVGYPKPLDMNFQQEGVVKEVLVKEGDSAKKGQKLLQLDDFKPRQQLEIELASLKLIELKLQNAQEEILPNLREKLREAEINLQQAKSLLDRYRQVEAAGSITKSDLDKAEKEFEKAQSRYNQAKIEMENFEKSGLLASLQKELEIARSRIKLARRSLEETSLVAPFDGKIIRVDVQVGERVLPGRRVLTMIEDKKWNFVLKADQRELPFLKPGLKAYVILDAFPERKIEAEIVYVCSEVNRETNTCELRIEVQEDVSFIKFGMAGKAEILAEKFEQALAFPARLIRKGSQGEFVWLWDNARAKKEKINYQRVGERLAIAKNLNPGQIILDAPAEANPNKLKPGKKALSL
ncbi:MAG: efflux RND transporter periplasmic adaptor subunit [Candidatus Aminicenantes bacterium]|nr:efflux RND transporter periplasmic adaptor subunit [Candidatus Aminicenantes bacterium]